MHLLNAYLSLVIDRKRVPERPRPTKTSEVRVYRECAQALGEGFRAMKAETLGDKVDGEKEMSAHKIRTRNSAENPEDPS